MTNTRYPVTHHNNEIICQKLDQPVPEELISKRSAGGNKTLSYIKGDITADRLNEVFGPLGWSATATTPSINRFEETRKKQDGNRGQIDVDYIIYAVTTQVTLTIKPQVPGGTDTVFTQSGVGYGEVEANKHAKDAVGMAVKGAETDGLKRCSTLLGRAFGMFLTGDGSQDDIDYAHNNNETQKKKAKEIRSRRNQNQRAPERNERQNERQTDHPRDEQQSAKSSTAEESRQNARPASQTKPVQTNSDEEKQDREPSRAKRDSVQDNQGSQRNEAPKDNQAAKPKGQPPKADVDTNFDLESDPLTRDDQISYGATFVKKLDEADTHENKIKLFNTHRNTIKKFDGPVLKKIAQHLERNNINMDTVPA